MVFHKNQLLFHSWHVPETRAIGSHTPFVQHALSMVPGSVKTKPLWRIARLVQTIEVHTQICNFPNNTSFFFNFPLTRPNSNWVHAVLLTVHSSLAFRVAFRLDKVKVQISFVTVRTWYRDDWDSIQKLRSDVYYYAPDVKHHHSSMKQSFNAES